jgi:hypothetical protein
MNVCSRARGLLVPGAISYMQPSRCRAPPEAKTVRSIIHRHHLETVMS